MKITPNMIVVVTGAGSGIGRASAHVYARTGAKLHLVDICEERLTEVRDELAPITAYPPITHSLDCTDALAMKELAAWIIAREGRVDILQNGVGILVAAPVEQLTLEDWQRTMTINLWSVIHGVHAFLPHLLRQDGRAHLVNIASMAGLVGFPYTLPYSTTKFAIVGLSEALGAELSGRGVGVTVVCPGMVRSNLLADGVLRLPGSWTAVVQAAYEHLAPDAASIARQILKAIRRDQRVIVPSLALAQLWLLKRLSGGVYYRSTSIAMSSLRRLGLIPELPMPAPHDAI